MATNYSILQRNLLASLETEEAQDALLWAWDKDNTRFKYPAEEYVREVENLSRSIPAMIAMTRRVHAKTPDLPQATDEQADDLRSFLMTRHKNLRFPKGAPNGN